MSKRRNLGQIPALFENRAMRGLRAALAIASLCLLCARPGDAEATATIARVSVAGDGTQAASGSGPSFISADGRFVAFASAASNLVPGDTNDLEDIFVHDRLTGDTTRVNVASDGTESNDVANAHALGLSADGRFVAFTSHATNLVPDDTNRESDVFLHDRATGETTRVSLTDAGSESLQGGRFPSISGDGRFVAFESSGGLVAGAPESEDGIYVHDTVTGETEWVTEALDPSASSSTDEAVISANGRFVAYRSGANLPPIDIDGETDVFVFDRATGTTAIATPSRSGDEERLSVDDPFDISADGRFVVFASPDAHPFSEILVYDFHAGALELVSVSSDGAAANESSWAPTISEDGRYVAFLSHATNLAPGEPAPGLFIHDRQTRTTTRVDTYDAYSADFSGDGSLLAFTSGDVSLVPDDTNDTTDVFVYDHGTLDVTPPVVDFSGNLGYYAVDEFVSITCTASDDQSGLASTTCEDIVGPAYEFDIGNNLFSAFAIDNEGNVASVETTFVVEASPAAISNVVRDVVSDDNLARSLTSQLASADIRAFINHVEAQLGKRIPRSDATLLIELARTLF